MTMAARNVTQYDSDAFDNMDKLPTNTLKRNPKNVDLTKTELLRLLSYLEGELQARDISIAALKAEKAKQLLYQAKYGRFGLGDPFHALQRDSDCQKDNSFDESAVKAMYDNQLMQLENLIETQRKAQMRMREQLAAVEKRYHKVCAELEEEKRRHAKDAEEGDNVTCMLEKERERLKQELEFEKSQYKKLEKELKKTNISTVEEKSMADKHKHVAVKLIKERSMLVEKIISLQQRNTQLEQTLKEEQSKTKEMAEGLSSESQKSHQMEASLEKCLSDFDTEREQLKLKISREEGKSRELTAEVEKLKFLFEQAERQITRVDKKLEESPKTIEIKNSLGNKLSSAATVTNKTERVASPNLTTSPRGQSNVGDVNEASPPQETGSASESVVGQSLSPNTVKSPQTTQSHNTPTLEFLGQEMDDLQQILVSMATVPEMGSSSSEDLTNGLPVTKPGQDGKKPIENGMAMLTDNIDLNRNSNSPQTIDPRLLLLKYIQDSDWLGLQEYLNHQSGTVNINQSLQLGNTVGHIVAEKGQLDCLRLVLNLGLKVNVVNEAGHSVLHSAVAGGQLACCKLLLEYGANLEVKNKEQLNVFHVAAKLGAVGIFELLVEFCVNNSPEVLSKLLEETDLDCNNVVFLAAMQNTSDMLDIISRHCEIDIYIPNHNGKTLVDVASPACLSVLEKQEPQKITCSVMIDMATSSNTQQHQQSSSPTVIGYTAVSKDATWTQVEELLGNVLLTHFTNTYNGMRSKRTMVKSEADSPDSQAVDTSLGLTLTSVKYFGIGIYFWSPGTPSDRRPFDLLKNSQQKQVSVRLFGQDDACLDNFTYESLIPLPQLQNYLRLIEQYGNVIFYGPTGTGKTFVCRKLAQIMQAKENQLGRVSEINFVAVHDKFSKNDLHSLLLQTGCLLHSTKPGALNYASILVLDGLEKTSVLELFTDIAALLNSRGPNTTVSLAIDNKGLQSYYLHSNCYILGTMCKTRLPVLEMSLQQSFRWIQFRNDQEPIRCLLHRHFYRLLLHQYSGSIPPQEDTVFKSVEWIICVWQRLNEGLLKLGLHENVLGPATFLSCPIEFSKSKQILRWLNNLWNQLIAPTVSKAVLQGSVSDMTSTGGQQKVASTALYVLMQRSVVSGCPLSGQEKERYLSSFQGSNELDIKIRRERNKSNVSTPSTNIPDSAQNTSDSFTINMDLSPEPQQIVSISNNNHSRNYFTTGRNPLQKSASLPSNNVLMAGGLSGNGNRNRLGSGSVNTGNPLSPRPFSLTPKLFNAVEAPKSFSGPVQPVSGIPTAVKGDGQRSARSNSVTATGGSQTPTAYSRRILAGSPLPQQQASTNTAGVSQGASSRPAGTRSATQSPLLNRFQGLPLSVPVNVTQSASSPEIGGNQSSRAGASQVVDNVSQSKIPAYFPTSQVLRSPLSNSSSRSPHEVGGYNVNNNIVGLPAMSGVSRAGSNAGDVAFIQRQAVINSKAGVTVKQSYSSHDTSSLRRAFSPTPQPLCADDQHKTDSLRRSFSPAPDMIFSRKDGDDKGSLPFSLPRK